MARIWASLLVSPRMMQLSCCSLPSPMSNPGLTPEWASITLDSHQKNFADECAICFSEIAHDFRVAELNVKAEDFDDVASAGTAESDDFASCARPATYVAAACEHGLDHTSKMGISNDLSVPLPDIQGSGDVYDIVHGCGTSSAAESTGCASPVHTEPPPREAPQMRRSTQPLVGHELRTELRTDVAGDDRDAHDGESIIRLDDGRHPDFIADDIMNQPANLCTKEHLEFLYKTCRCVSCHQAAGEVLLPSVETSICHG
jgi:hypothetical protein